VRNHDEQKFYVPGRVCSTATVRFNGKGKVFEVSTGPWLDTPPEIVFEERPGRPAMTRYARDPQAAYRWLLSNGTRTD